MADAEFTKETVELDTAQKKSRRARNYAIAFCLIAFILVMFFGTMAKMASVIATSGA
jgi:t-SNARE complex subunit (syntaxin)